MRKKRVMNHTQKCIWEKLRKESGFGDVVNKEDVNRVLGMMCHFPKEDRNKIIDELIYYGFIIQVSRGRNGIEYKILG